MNKIINSFNAINSISKKFVIFSMNLWYLIFIIIFFTFGIESGKIRPNFDEIFGEEWDKNEKEEKGIKIEENERNGNTQSVEVDQMGEEMKTDPIDQMSEYSNQNMIKSDQSTREEPNDQQKREIIQKFEAIKEKLMKKGKYQNKNRVKIERKIGKLLGVNRQKIYNWKKELNLNKMNFYERKKSEFLERFDEFKNLYSQGKQKKFVKKLGIGETTLRKWKKELVPKYHKTQNKYSNEDKIRKMNEYFKIKKRNAKNSDQKIAEKLGIGLSSLKEWKQKFASVSDM